MVGKTESRRESLKALFDAPTKTPFRLAGLGAPC